MMMALASAYHSRAPEILHGVDNKARGTGMDAELKI
jgi:hypothetical protein